MDFQLLMSLQQYTALPFAAKLWVVQSVSIGTIVSLLTLQWGTRHAHNNNIIARLLIVLTNAVFLGCIATAFWPFGVIALISSYFCKYIKRNRNLFH